MGNGFAYTILAIWPLIAIYLYRTQSIQMATLWTIVGGFMILPVKTAVDLPMVPPMGKHTVPVLSALLGCWLIKKKRVSYFRELGNIKYLVLLLLAVPFFTVMLNGDAVHVGNRYLPGLTYYDGLSSVVNQFLLIGPFFIGRQFFKTYGHQLLMFKFLVVAGLVYSIPMLFEVRMSPQLHTWIYGYFPHSFAQQIRFGGFRPVVFMGHGLWVAFFAAITLICAIALWNNRIKATRFASAYVSCYLTVVLILCKSIASLLYGVFAFIMLKRTKPKRQHQIAVLLACLALLYPSLSITKIFPHQTVVDTAMSFSPERAQSLQFRFDNEGTLLDKGRERFFFGWGGWGRSRVYNEETGRDTSVTDGRWIITFGQYGLFGFIAEFGLLAVSIFRAYAASKIVESKTEQSLLAAHALLIGIVMMDQLPNASLQPWLWLLTGVLLGRADCIINEKRSNRLHPSRVRDDFDCS